MLHRCYTLLLVGLLAVAAAVQPAQAQDRKQEIRTMLEQRDKQIKVLLGTSETISEAQREQLRTVINDGIDFRAMGRLALGKHWAALTEAQRTDFVNVFSEIVRAQSLSDLDVYRAPVAYQRIDVKGDSAYVVTTITYKEVPTQVDYVLGANAASWHVVDIILDEVSTADGYARSFQTLIRKKGFDELMAKLRQKRDAVTATSR